MAGLFQARCPLGPQRSQGRGAAGPPFVELVFRGWVCFLWAPMCLALCLKLVYADIEVVLALLQKD